MKKYFALLFCALLFSCDDGDFDIPTFNFEEQAIQYCGEVVFFKIDLKESLIIELNINEPTKDFLLTEMDAEIYTLTSGGANNISYRTFNEVVTASYFCQAIPPVTPKTESEWLGTSNLYITNTIVYGDDDGVDEQDLTVDTDNDGVLDYLDNDDDGDGVLTKNELDDDGNPLDTDLDGIYDYLDTDDDNDNTLTILELLIDSDNDPESIPDYLDPNTSDALATARDQINDSYIATYSMEFTLEDLLLELSLIHI